MRCNCLLVSSIWKSKGNIHSSTHYNHILVFIPKTHSILTGQEVPKECKNEQASFQHIFPLHIPSAQACCSVFQKKLHLHLKMTQKKNHKILQFFWMSSNLRIESIKSFLPFNQHDWSQWWKTIKALRNLSFLGKREMESRVIQCYLMKWQMLCNIFSPFCLETIIFVFQIRVLADGQIKCSAEDPRSHLTTSFVIKSVYDFA